MQIGLPATGLREAALLMIREQGIWQRPWMSYFQNQQPEEMDMSGERIKVCAVIAAPLEKVWECWTEPLHIKQWNFASDDWCCPSAENELKVGGRFKSRMEAKDGSFGFDFEGVYDEISPLKTLSYTMSDGRKSTTIFEAQGDSTKVTTVFDAEQENSIDMQRDGWQAILNSFKKHVEKTSRE